MMRMTQAECIVATTINAAHALNRARTIGSLEAGKRADLIILDVPKHHFLGYNCATNLVEALSKQGVSSSVTVRSNDNKPTLGRVQR
jgi:imidazolonepropionase